MAKYNFKEKGKAALMTAAEVGVVGGSMLLTKKFLDFNTLFKSQIAKDPTYADKWFIKHQGAIKFTAGVLGAIHINNPWLRLISIGVAVVGLVEEVRVLTVDTQTGESFFDKIGSRTYGKRPTDAELYAAAISAGATNPTDEYPTQVGYTNPTDEFPTMVGAWDMQQDSMPKSATTVGAW